VPHGKTWELMSVPKRQSLVNSLNFSPQV
jgi:hypothetical protein